MAPVTRLAAATDPGAAAAVVADAPQAGSSGATPFGRLVVGETDDYDAPAPAPRLHAALLVITVLPLCVDVPASFAIVATATLAILAGSWRSVKAAPPAETMTQKDAMRFPLIGSCFLVGLFLLFKFLPKDLVNAILSAYFVFLGVLAIAACLAPFAAAMLPRQLARRTLSLGQLRLPTWLGEPWDVTASVPELACGVVAVGVCLWYYRTKHWLANNALGLAFSLQGLEHIGLGSIKVGALLLGGLFVYDVFWVFCTPVMVTVAKSFDAPIKLLFPRGAAAASSSAVAAAAVANATKVAGDVVAAVTDVAPATSSPEKPFNMLGLGDIVIPGIFVALVLRMDAARMPGGGPTMGQCWPPYFRAVVGGYVGGLATTIGVMNAFNAAQPALLYIVPAVLGAVALLAAARKELGAVAAWSEEEDDRATSSQDEAAQHKKDT